MVSRMARLESLLGAVDDALVGMDRKGVIWCVNRQTELLFGYDRGGLVGLPIETILPEHPGRTGAGHQDESFADPRTLSGGVERQLTGRRRDGTGLPVNITISSSDAGDILTVVTAVADLTHQKQAVRQAFEAAQRMAAIVESSDDAIVGGSLDGIVTSWNPAAERMYGYSSQEIVGRPASCLTPADRTTEISDVLARIEAGQRVEHLATRRVRKDATVFPVSLTVSPIRDADGAIVGTSVIHRDLSELEHAALYARSLIEASLDPMATISPEGKVTDVNQAMVTVTGVPRQALIDTEFSQYVTDPATVQEGFERAFRQGPLTDIPLTLVHQDGTLTDVLCNVSLYRDVDGTVLGLLAVARDASMLRHQQRLSGQLQEALSSRVAIEQAKGITAQRLGITVDQAYQLIRAHARDHHASLRAVAAAIVEVGLQI